MNAQDLEQRARELLAGIVEQVCDPQHAANIAKNIRENGVLAGVPSHVVIPAIVAALRQQPAPVVDGATVSALQSTRDRMMAALTPKFGDAFDGDFDVMLEAINTLKRLRTPTPPAPVMDDARMARALEWVRTNAAFEFPHIREHIPAIEEAIAAYNPSCGARTVRVVDDALADTQRAIIEAAERRGYERAKAEAVVVDDAMRKDSERLDWLDANGFTAYRSIDPIDGLSCHFVVVHETMKPRRGNVADTIRKAIDLALAQGVQS